VPGGALLPGFGGIKNKVIADADAVMTIRHFF
jgi:hypothetical protein